MDYATYKLLHFVGMIFLFLGLGGLFLASWREDAPRPKVGLVLHGIGLVVLVVAGFGMQAKLPDLGFPGWLIAKIVAWVLLGALPFFVKRGFIPRATAWAAAAVLGAAAVWLVMERPF